MGKVAQFKRFWLSGTETAIDNHVRSLGRHDRVVFADSVCDRHWDYEALSPSDGLGRGLTRLLSRGRRLDSGLRDWYTLELLCRDIALMHVHFGTDGIYYMPVSAAADVPMVVTFHGHDAYRFPYAMHGLGHWYLRKLFRAASRVMTVSDHMRHQLESLGCPNDKLQTVRVGIDLTRFDFTARKPGPVVRFTCIAGLREKKGLGYLIEAFRRVRAERRDVELTLVGDGPLRLDLERQIADADLADCVTLTGHLPPRSVAEILGESHVYCQPSVTAANGDREGIPATVMEAMARGLPVVATYHSGIPELVQDGISGFLVGERDVDGLAEAMLLMAESPMRWGPMGEAGRERVEKLHDIRRQTAVIEDIYDQTMASPDAAAVHLIGQVQQDVAERRAA